MGSLNKETLCGSLVGLFLEGQAMPKSLMSMLQDLSLSRTLFSSGIHSKICAPFQALFLQLVSLGIISMDVAISH